MLHPKIVRKAREESYVPCQRINLSRLEDNQYQDGEGGRRPCLESKRRSPILHIVTTTLNHFASSNTSKNNESYKEENQLRRIITKRSQAWPTMTDNAKARSVDVTLFFNTFFHHHAFSCYYHYHAAVAEFQAMCVCERWTTYIVYSDIPLYYRIPT